MTVDEIKRWEVVDGNYGATIVPHPKGEVVCWADYKAALEAKEAEIEALRAEVAALRTAGVTAEYAPNAEQDCSTHPDAPHGFDRNMSHNLGRYVCECENWKPKDEP